MNTQDHNLAHLHDESAEDYFHRRDNALDDREGPVRSLEAIAEDGLWFHSSSNVLVLADWLEDGGCFESTRDVIRYFEKPWKWADEWAAYGRHVTYEAFLEEEAKLS